MLTFEQCATKLGNRNRKKIDNNTWLEKVSDDLFVVKLYSTDIIRIHKDGTFTLSAAGHRTRTTQTRFKKYAPAYPTSQKQQWIIQNIPFFDGIKLDQNGKILNPGGLQPQRYPF